MKQASKKPVVIVQEIEAPKQQQQADSVSWLLSPILMIFMALALVIVFSLFVSAFIYVHEDYTQHQNSQYEVSTNKHTEDVQGSAKKPLRHLRHLEDEHITAEKKTLTRSSRRASLRPSENKTEPLKSLQSHQDVSTRGAIVEDMARIEGVISAREINLSNIYTPWSKWSRCRRKKCKQIRKRRCLVSSICGSNVLKEERPCPKKSHCRKQQKRKNFHVVKRRRTRGMLRYRKVFYSGWSKWTTCSKDCKTSRTRTCKYMSVCGWSAVHEEAFCYTEGSQCEAIYRRGKSLAGFSSNKRGTHEGVIKKGEKKSSPGSESKQHSQRAAVSQCGIRREDREHNPIPNAGYKVRIIGGKEAKEGHWPWQVAILNQVGEVFCGGTLVAPGWVLTAAHCVRKHLYIRIGEYDLMVDKGNERDYFVEHSIPHKDYNPDTVDNDVALLKFSSDSDRDNFPSMACLPDAGQPLPDSKHKCTIIGWGKQKSSHIYGTDTLHEAEVPIVSMPECLKANKDYPITKNMFCAGYEGGGVDSCAGDSGGPLLCEDDHGRWTVLGVTSFGDGCGEAGKFGVYARVSNFVHWIEDTISKA